MLEDASMFLEEWVCVNEGPNPSTITINRFILFQLLWNLFHLFRIPLHLFGIVQGWGAQYLVDYGVVKKGEFGDTGFMEENCIFAVNLQRRRKPESKAAQEEPE